MSLWSRITNVFRADRLSREIDEELETHIADAIAEGRDPAEARRAFGAMLQRREESRDLRVLTWLDSLRSDVIFGLRQLRKRKMTSAAAILSLALALGACASAFRLIDAMLFRPLPISHPERLYSVVRQGFEINGKPSDYTSFEYPLFRQMRAALKDQVELIAVSGIPRIDLTYASDREMEKAYRQYVSGWMFPLFGLQPAIGRLFTENDDLKPGAHPYAVLSHDYWTRRFARDPKAVGRTFRIGNTVYEIVGVVGQGFTGTEPGTMVDVFLPTMMNSRAIEAADWSWFRTLAVVSPGIALGPINDKLSVIVRESLRERIKTETGMPKQWLDNVLKETIALQPAPAGASGMQKNYRRSLLVLGVLVGLVLLIACANIANLMTAQATARAREMAMRVSIGAGRLRLVQLVLVESALLALIASLIGGWIAWWSAPWIVGKINPSGAPARLDLPIDWRVAAFGIGLAFCVTALFGLAPALRASAVRPLSALKGGEDPHSRRRLMHVLIAAQVAFCFIVHFVAGLFVSTYDRLTTQPLGFSTDRLLVLETVATNAQPMNVWDEVMDRVRNLAGVESVSLAGWPPLRGDGWSGLVYVNGAGSQDESTYFLGVNPGFVETMKIPLLAGRDLRPDDAYPGAALINETFAKRYFPNESPLGKQFERKGNSGSRLTFQVVGVMGDARYRNMREPIRPTAYVPVWWNKQVGEAAMMIRTSNSNPLALASTLRQAVPQARSDFRVSNLRLQQDYVDDHTVRERLLAMLSLFFAGVALLLAGVGLYGVLDYSVLQRRREIGIRMALGARAPDVARRITVEVFGMVLIGALTGFGLGMACQQYVETLLFQVKATDFTMLAGPSVIILLAALLAAIPPVIRATRIDPSAMLRAE